MAEQRGSVGSSISFLQLDAHGHVEPQFRLLQLCAAQANHAWNALAIDQGDTVEVGSRHDQIPTGEDVLVLLSALALQEDARIRMRGHQTTASIAWLPLHEQALVIARDDLDLLTRTCNHLVGDGIDDVADLGTIDTFRGIVSMVLVKLGTALLDDREKRNTEILTIDVLKAARLGLTPVIGCHGIGRLFTGLLRCFCWWHNSTFVLPAYLLLPPQ